MRKRKESLPITLTKMWCPICGTTSDVKTTNNGLTVPRAWLGCSHQRVVDLGAPRGAELFSAPLRLAFEKIFGTTGASDQIVVLSDWSPFDETEITMEENGEVCNR